MLETDDYLLANELTGRIEIRTFLLFYLVSLPLQLVTTGSLLKQSSTALVAVTAVHMGIVAALFWALLANALVATQVVEGVFHTFSLMKGWRERGLHICVHSYLAQMERCPV